MARINGFAVIDAAMSATTFAVANAPVFCRGSEVEDARTFIVRRGDGVAVGLEISDAAGELVTLADRGKLSVIPHFENQGGVLVLVSADVGFAPSRNVWVSGRFFDDDLTREEKSWRARTALAGALPDRHPLPAPLRPLGDGEPLQVDIVGEIGVDVFASPIVAAILARPDATIIMAIDSNGGNVEEALTIYRALVAHRCAVFSNVVKAESGAAIIALAADVRSIAADATMLLHPPTFASVDRVDFDDLIRHADALARVTSELAGIVAARTGNTIDAARTWLGDETVFNAGDALGCGLAHRVDFSSAPITPAAIRARFAPIHGPFRATRGSAARRAA